MSALALVLQLPSDPAALFPKARRIIMLEYATEDAGKATIIGVVDSITIGVGVVAPLIGAIAWAQIGYSAPFMIGAFVNVFACLPMLALLRRKR